MVETLDVKYVLSWARASTAKTRSRAASDLRTKPRAPAFKTSRTICSDSCRVRISTLASGFVFKICRVASSPFRLGAGVVPSRPRDGHPPPRRISSTPVERAEVTSDPCVPLHGRRPRRFAVSSWITSTGSWCLGRYSSYSGLVYPVKAVLAPGAYVSTFATKPNWSDAQFHAGDRCVHLHRQIQFLSVRYRGSAYRLRPAYKNSPFLCDPLVPSDPPRFLATAQKTKAPRLWLESRRSSNSLPQKLFTHKLQSPQSSGNGTAVPLG